jgi:hypothetical protein
MKVIIYILYVILAGSKIQNGFAAEINYEGRSLDGQTTCQLSLSSAPNNTSVLVESRLATLTINSHIFALGNENTATAERIFQIPTNNIPNLQKGIRLFANSHASLFDANIAKKVFLFLDENDYPKLMKGVIYVPELKQFDCGQFEILD